mgnify:FL=1|jgi:hypothetical protein
MIDFNKKIKNSNKFRSPALTYIESGSYCSFPKGTSEYFNFWETEADRCINGYTADDGDYITGYNYFYLNYCPIQRIVYKNKKNKQGQEELIKVRELAFPDFYDYDYYYFQAIESAQDQGKHLCVAKARRKGYEQPYSEPVLTPTGYVPMGSLKVGDLVMNPNGSPVRIGDIVEQGTTEIYEVEFQDGRKVRCGANHLWATCRNGKKFYIMRTTDYMKRKLKQGSPGKEHYPYKIPELNPLKFDERPVTVDPYVLGVLLGDGYICGDQVRFSTADEFIVQELQRRLPDYTIEHKEQYSYVIKSKVKGVNELNRQLKDLKVKVKSYDKFIPENYKFTSIENRFELIRGLMDTDGSVTNGACGFVSTSEQLIDDVVFILRSLGIRCKKSKEIPGRNNVDFNNGNYSDTRPHWELTVTTEEDIFKLPRKLEKIRKDRKYNYKGIGIKSIRKTGEFEKQRCLCIDNENHLYITKDFIPTHNSYKGGSMLCRNFFLIPGSKSYVYASNKQYLTDDGILTKAWDYMDFIDENTAWGKKRQAVNTSMRRRASMIVTDNFGNKIEVGYKSEIIGVSLKDNPDAVRGKAGMLILWEEAGTFPELKAAWQIARPSVEQDGVAFGLMIMFGTGGDEGPAVMTLREAFYNPKSYNCIGFENIWDDGIQSKECGFFIPQHTNLDIRDETGKRLYMDEDGNTLHDKARQFILNLREEELKEATSSQQIDRYVAEHSESPAEAFTELSGNIFPKKELQKQLARIRTNTKLQNHKQVGTLTLVNGEIIWNIQKTGDITEFPLPKNSDPTGKIVIWEHPVKDAPFGLYIAGIDPYDHDQSGTNSLGSCFIYKRFQDFESYSDIIVAEYTGRPKTAEEFYENVRKLLIYYNAKAMVENQNTGLFTYFNNKHCSHLLADQPDIIKDIVNNSTVNRRKGCHMNREIKLWGEGKIKEWLEELRDQKQLGLNTVLSEPFLEELIQYNDKGNFDRVMAFMQVMVYREQLYNIQVKKKEDVEKKMRLFDKPLFKNTDDSFTFTPLNNNTTTFMFTN